MLKLIHGKELKDITAEHLHLLADPYSAVVVDLGTGDGKFAYRLAGKDAEKFVIGIDASEAELPEISRKAAGKPAKGGLPNVVYLKLAVEQITEELADLADEIYVNFPWGSLLSGVVLASSEVMTGIVTLAKPGAMLQITLTYDTAFEPEKMSELELPELTLDYLNTELAQRYAEFGIGILNVRLLDEEEKRSFPSSWPKKILSKRNREVYQIKAIID